MRQHLRAEKCWTILPSPGGTLTRSGCCDLRYWSCSACQTSANSCCRLVSLLSWKQVINPLAVLLASEKLTSAVVWTHVNIAVIAVVTATGLTGLRGGSHGYVAQGGVLCETRGSTVVGRACSCDIQARGTWEWWGSRSLGGHVSSCNHTLLLQVLLSWTIVVSCNYNTIKVITTMT